MNRCVIFDRLRKTLTGLALMAGAAWPTAHAAEPPPVVVVLWSAGDCVWCKIWKTGDRHDEFQAEAARLGSVRLITLAKPSLRDPDSSYRLAPDDATHTAAPPTATAPKLLPSFDFLCNGKPVRRLIGMGDWDSFWRSQLRQLARECPAAARS